MKNKKLVLASGIAVILIAGGAYYLFVASPQAGKVSVPSAPSTPSTAVQAQTNPVSASVQAGVGPVIADVSMSTALTASGAAANPVTSVSSAAPALYAVLSLKNATARTQLSYIRYYQGKYVDSKVSHPTMNRAKYFHFSWALKAGQSRKAGAYTLVLYVDGKKSTAINYTVR